MPLSVEDRLEIQDLIARYNHAIDSGRAEDWAATFAPDGTFETRGEIHTGTDALLAFARGFQERMAGATHWNNNIIVDGDGDEARSSCYLMLRRGGEVLSEARYEDTLRRIDGRWRFTSRRVLRPE